MEYLQAFFNTAVGYFSQAENKENAILISRQADKFYRQSLKWTELQHYVLSILPNYDMSTLREEMTSLIGMGQMYSKWQTVEREKQFLPFLRYSIVSDPTTCKTCRKLNNIVRPVGDPFWDIYYPPNCPECRCDVLQEDRFARPTDLTKKDLLEPIQRFRFNVGKDQIITAYN